MKTQEERCHTPRREDLHAPRNHRDLDESYRSQCFRPSEVKDFTWENDEGFDLGVGQEEETSYSQRYYACAD